MINFESHISTSEICFGFFCCSVQDSFTPISQRVALDLKYWCTVSEHIANIISNENFLNLVLCIVCSPLVWVFFSLHNEHKKELRGQL